MLAWAKARDVAKTSFEGTAGIFTAGVIIGKLMPLESQGLTK